MIRRAQIIGLLAPASLLLIATGVLPLALVLFYSLNESFGSDFMFVGGQWYAQMLSSNEFLSNVLRSLAFSGLALAIEIPLGLFIALRLPREGKLASVLLVSMVLPLLTPNLVVGYLFKALSLPQVGLLTWAVSLLGLDLDLKNSVAAWCLLIVMDVWHWTSLVVLFTYAGLKAIPQEYYRAAQIDAASAWGAFLYVQLPRLKVMLGIAAILRFMDSFMIYSEPLVLTHGGPKTSTAFVASAFFQTKKSQFELGYGSAVSIFCFLVVVTVSLLLFRMMIRQRASR